MEWEERPRSGVYPKDPICVSREGVASVHQGEVALFPLHPKAQWEEVLHRDRSHDGAVPCNVEHDVLRGRAGGSASQKSPL